MTPRIKTHAVYIFLSLLSLLSLLTVQLNHFADDPGVGWHLATGAWIIKNLAIPVYDPFLASAQPRLWISDQWASDIVLYVLYRLGSWPLLYVALLLAYFLTFWSLLAAKLSKRSKNVVAIALTCFFASKLAQVHFILRPVLFSFPFLILVRTLLDDMQERSAAHLYLQTFLQEL